MIVAAGQMRGWLRVLLGLLILTSLGLFAVPAGAVVVDMSSKGQSTVPFNAGARSGYYGVALVPGTVGNLSAAPQPIPTVVSSAPCTDPALTGDLRLPSNGLCFHGGPVMHRNETVALTWDPLRRYYAGTRNYLEQFLSDVAAGSGRFSSPFADTTQYTDGSGRAGNASVYGGGCIDYGAVGGDTCLLAGGSETVTGTDYPANGCSATGTDQFAQPAASANDVCLTDAQLRGELTSVVERTGLLGRTKPSYTPLIVMLTPPGVVDCLDAAGELCSANSASGARFCSYHGQVSVSGTEVPYLVQPWTADTAGASNGCDFGAVPSSPDPTGLGAVMASPLSAAQLAAITNPGLGSWFGLDGSEINDNYGCSSPPPSPASVTVGTSAQNPYLLQPEFNNAGVIESDPDAPPCTLSVGLTPNFVVPSAVNEGDVVEFDGSTSRSTLIVPRAGYAWSFGDGHTAVGPSVVHTFAKPGVYTVKLTLTDRGGNAAIRSQTITVLSPSGQPGAPGTGTGTGPANVLRVGLELLPESLRNVLRSGLALVVSANERAAGITQVFISNVDARRARIPAGPRGAVQVGLGTVSSVRKGAVTLRLRLARGVTAKLRRLQHATLTVRMTLVGVGGDHTTVIVAGHY